MVYANLILRQKFWCSFDANPSIASVNLSNVWPTGVDKQYETVLKVTHVCNGHQVVFCVTRYQIKHIDYCISGICVLGWKSSYHKWSAVIALMTQVLGRFTAFKNPYDMLALFHHISYVHSSSRVRQFESFFFLSLRDLYMDVKATSSTDSCLAVSAKCCWRQQSAG